METHLGDQDESPKNDSANQNPVVLLRTRKRFRKEIINSMSERISENILKNHTRTTSEFGTRKISNMSATPEKSKYHIINTEKDEPGTKINLETEMFDKDIPEILPSLQDKKIKSSPAKYQALAKEILPSKSIKDRIKDPENIKSTPQGVLGQVVGGGWKKAKKTLMAVIFKSEANNLMDQKQKVIMEGDKTKTKKKITCSLYINPDSTLKMLWDFVISITILYHILIVGFRWGQRLNPMMFTQYDLIIDGLLFLDILFNFITGRTHKKIAITKRSEIAKHYLKGTFTLDAIAMCPFYLIDNDLYLIKVFRIFQVSKVFHVLRFILIRVSRQGIFILEYTKFLLITIMVLHILICFWIFIGQADFMEKPSWISLIPENQSALSYYVDASYFVVTTASTVGYGDIIPVNKLEMVYCMALELMGIIVVSISQSRAMQILQEEEKFLNRTKQHDLEVEWWLLKKEKAKNNNEKGLPISNPPLANAMNKIQNYFRFHVCHDLNGILHNEFEFYNKLSPNLQQKIVFNVFHNYMNKFQVFFSQIKEEGFLREIVTRMNPKLFFYEQKIVKRGTPARGLYFMLQGCVKVSYIGHPMCILPENSFFGDSFILGQNSDLDYVVCSENNLKCLFIDRRSFFEVEICLPEKRSFQRSIKYKIATLHERLDTSLHTKFPHGQGHLHFDRTPLSANQFREDEPTPDDRPSTDQPPGKKPGSFLRKKWAEDGEKMKIFNESVLSSSEENVVYVENIDIPDDFFLKDNSEDNESCELQQQYFISTHADFLPNFIDNHASEFFGKKDTNDYSTSNITTHAADVPNISKQFDSSKLLRTDPLKSNNYANELTSTRLNFASFHKPECDKENELPMNSFNSQQIEDEDGDDFEDNKERFSKKTNTTIDNKPSLREVLDFYDKLTHKRKKFLTRKISTFDAEESDPNTSIDSGDYSSDEVSREGDYSDVDSQDNDELNNSMEAPLDPTPHDIFDINDIEGFIACLESRVEILNYKLARISKVCRDEVMDEWTNMKHTNKRFKLRYGFLMMDDFPQHYITEDDHYSEEINLHESEIDTQRPLFTNGTTSAKGPNDDIHMLDTKETARDEKK